MRVKPTDFLVGIPLDHSAFVSVLVTDSNIYALRMLVQRPWPYVNKAKQAHVGFCQFQN